MYQSRACVELNSRAISMRELFSAGTKLIPHFSAHNPAKHFRDLIFLVGFDIEYCFPSWMLVCGSRPSSFPLPLDPPPPPLLSPPFSSISQCCSIITTDLCIYTNVNHSLAEVEVGVFCFRQKILAFLLSSGWV